MSGGLVSVGVGQTRFLAPVGQPGVAGDGQGEVGANGEGEIADGCEGGRQGNVRQDLAP